MFRRRHQLRVERLEQRRVLSGTTWFEDTGQELGTTSWAVSLADLDGDYDLDVFVGCYNDWPANPADCNENVVWLNDGSGNFSQGWRGETGSVIAVALGDLDNDGDLDVYVGRGGIMAGGADEVLLNDGGGNFENTGQRLATGPSGDVALGDVDSDGDLDAFVTRGSNMNGPLPVNKASVWLNDGHGNFSDSGQEFGRGDGHAIALGDLDGDGDLDAFLAQGHQGQSDAVFLNDGQGNFTDSGQRLGGQWANGVELADLDGDGDLDAYVANGNQFGSSQPDYVWMNDGTGLFTRSEQDWRHIESRCMAMADIDGDGDLDAYVGTRGRDKLWLNDGSGHFSDSGQRTLSGGPHTSGAVAMGDIDSDGDPDAIVVKLGGINEVWLNVAPLPGDVNEDGSVGFADLVLLSNHFGESQAERKDGDLDGNGKVEFADFAILAANFGRTDAQRLLKGSLSGEVNFVPGKTENCPVVTVSDTSGTMSHLGKVQSHWEHCPPVVEPVYTNGHAVFTAANGDELRVEYGGDPGSPFLLDIVGGTGRFESASGTIIANFLAEGEFDDDGVPISPWYIQLDLSGTISYQSD